MECEEGSAVLGTVFVADESDELPVSVRMTETRHIAPARGFGRVIRLVDQVSEIIDAALNSWAVRVCFRDVRSCSGTECR